LTTLATIKTVAEAIAAYYKYQREHSAYETIRDCRRERTRLEEQLAHTSIAPDIHPDVRTKLMAIIDHRLRESHREVALAVRRFGETVSGTVTSSGHDPEELPNHEIEN